MLLSIQFPFADIRRFLHAPTGCISQPGWPSPIVPQDPKKIAPPFVRGFGAIRKRDGGGLEFWGEDVLCGADRAIKWHRGDTYPLSANRDPLRFEMAFRQLFFDGAAVGKCELGIATTGRPAFQLNTEDINGLAKWLLGHQVSVPSFIKGKAGATWQTVQLQEVSLNLRQHVLHATTRANWLRNTQRPLSDWWIGGGSPMLFLQLKAPAEGLEDGTNVLRFIDLPELGVNISCRIVDSDGISVPLWILWTAEKYDRTRARQLRLCLLRMHAEHESLRMVLDHLNTGRIKVRRDTVPTSLLQIYLEESSRRLFRNQTILERIASQQNPEATVSIAETATAIFERIWPGSSASLEQLLRQMDIRRNIGINLKRYSSNQDTSIGVINMIRNTGNNNVFNQDSDLKDVQQNTGDNVHQTQGAPVPIDSESMKKQMADLMQQLSEALAKLPPEKAEDKEAIEDMAARLKADAAKEQPNKRSLNLSAKGMLEAAEGIAGVVPIALKLSGLVASFIAGI